MSELDFDAADLAREQVHFLPLLVGLYRDASGNRWGVSLLALQARPGEALCPLLVAAQSHPLGRNEARLFQPTRIDDDDPGDVSFQLNFADALHYIATELLGHKARKGHVWQTLRDASVIEARATNTTLRSPARRKRPPKRRRGA